MVCDNVPVITSSTPMLAQRIQFMMVSMIDNWAYPGSEFVVASTLAKWIKLEPNGIYFSQGFSQKLFCI